MEQGKCTAPCQWEVGKYIGSNVCEEQSLSLSISLLPKPLTTLLRSKHFNAICVY